MTQTTLNIILTENQILLAMKKRSFGVGKWNAVGGKLQDTETFEQSAVRKTEEEIGVKVEDSDLEKVAILNFIFTDKPESSQECHVFISRKWSGEPIETDEMKPQWFSLQDIPYDSMWQDDKYWLPLVLRGKKIKADFYFSNEGKNFDKHEIQEWTE